MDKTDASIDLFYTFAIRTLETMVNILNQQVVRRHGSGGRTPLPNLLAAADRL